MASRKSQIIILGIDPGLANTGFGIIKKQGGKLEMVDYGCIKTKVKTLGEIRLVEIFQSLNKLIKKYNPEIIAVEQLFFCKNVKTAMAVGQARGVVMLAAGKNKLIVYEFTPMQIKLALSGYGKASKKQIQDMVKIILSLKTIPKPDHAADALATAVCCAHSI